MQTRYEVNRLSKNYLSTVYEKLIPIITHQIEPQEKDNGHLDSADIKQPESLDEQDCSSRILSSYLKRNQQ